MAKKIYPKKTAKHFAGDPFYQAVAYIRRYSDTAKDTAKRLNVSVSTVNLWLKYGISDHAVKNQGRRYLNIQRGLKSYEARLPADQRKEMMPFSYTREFNGSRVKYYNVQEASYLMMQYIILQECKTKLYAGYYFLLKFNKPFSGYWDGETSEYYEADGEGNLKDKDGRPLNAKERKQARLGSWVDVTSSQPFLNTKIFTLHENYCNVDILEETLEKFYFMEHFDIIEIRFNERKTFEGWE